MTKYVENQQNQCTILHFFDNILMNEFVSITSEVPYGKQRAKTY